MYFPYLRGKQFELESLLGVPKAIYANTLPIVEPVNRSSGRYYQRLARESVPFILIMNPQNPPNGRSTINEVQNTIVDGPLLAHPSLTLGFVIDQHFTHADLRAFLISNPAKAKAIIFRYNLAPVDLTAVETLLRAHPVSYLIFDDKRTSLRTRTTFTWHAARVLITDGFQRQERNSDYPLSSTFDTNVSTWRADGLAGIGDYLTVGDHFQEGGGQPLVVTLHLMIASGHGLDIHHFSSTINSTIKGGVAPKFSQACNMLVNSPNVRGLLSTGISMYQYWDVRNHLPHLGAAKQASIQHHIETMSRLI